MFRLLFLLVFACSYAGALEVPEDLPEKTAYLVEKFENDAAKERAAAEREVGKLRGKLMTSLEKEMKSVTKKGKLEEALKIKAVIEALEQEERENAADIFGTRRSSSKPKLKFVAEKSMPLFPVGTQMGPFPRQESSDALCVFEGKPMYFDQRTPIDDVVYEVQLPKPAKRLIYDGGAIANMTIEILDARGNTLGSGGPFQGGNRPHQFKVDFKPSREFVIKISNHIGMWYYIEKISFE